VRRSTPPSSKTAESIRKDATCVKPGFSAYRKAKGLKEKAFVSVFLSLL